MKLSEILKDWPEKKQWFYPELAGPDEFEKRLGQAKIDSANDMLTSCDYEIYRDELAKEIHKKEYRSIKWHESPLGIQNAYLARADKIISTMPTWLKRIEK